MGDESLMSTGQVAETKFSIDGLCDIETVAENVVLLEFRRGFIVEEFEEVMKHITDCASNMENFSVIADISAIGEPLFSEMIGRVSEIVPIVTNDPLSGKVDYLALITPSSKSAMVELLMATSHSTLDLGPFKGGLFPSQGVAYSFITGQIRLTDLQDRK